MSDPAELSLDEWMDAALEAPAEPARFTITDTSTADWALRKVRQAQEAIAAAEAEAAEWRERIDAWVEARTRSHRDTAQFMEGLLTAWHRSLFDEAVAEGLPEREWPKTIALPSGKLTSSAGAESLVVDEPHVLIGWLSRAKRADLLKVDVRVGDVKAAFGHADGRLVTEDGEIVPACRLQRGDRSFKVKPS